MSFGNLVFVAGKGAHFEGDIKAHTDHVLKTIEKELEKAGWSLPVYHDLILADAKAVNF